MEKRVTQRVSDDDFAREVLGADRPVLVDFSAEWCPPCKAMEPAIDALAIELADTVKIVKLDVDQSPAITAGYNVRSMPTLIVFRDGRPVDLKVGAQSRAQLLKWLEGHAV
jgi:thioredoxin 1